MGDTLFWISMLGLVIFIGYTMQYIDKLTHTITQLRRGIATLTSYNLELEEQRDMLWGASCNRKDALELEIKKNDALQAQYNELKCKYDALESKLNVAHCLGGVVTVEEETNV
jgi:hypothetical protein